MTDTTESALAQEFFNAPALYPTPVPLRQAAATAHQVQHPPGSSPWWLARLDAAMDRRNTRMERLRSYYQGTNDTWHLAAESHRNTFGQRFRGLRANLAQPVVEIPEQRMSVIGIDIAGDALASDRAWSFWQANQLDALSSEAHLEVLSVGECPVIVGAGANGPVITIEDPLQVIVETDPIERRTIRAALKRWADEDGRVTAVLYLPDQIEWWTAEPPKPGMPREWQQLADRVQQNPWGEVPIVTLRNRRSRAEHEGVLELLDLYAATLYNMATAAHHLAYRQRFATGISDDSRDEDPDTAAEGRARAKAGPDQIVTSEDPQTTFGSFEASDLGPFIQQLDSIRGDIGTVTHTPHRLLFPPPTSVPPTGESVRFQDYPLTAKVRRISRSVGDGWEDVIRLAFRVAGDRVNGARMDMETVWAEPELYAESVHIDALSKKSAMGVPDVQLWREMGYTPQQIRQWEASSAAFGDYVSPDEIASLIEQVKAGLRTSDEARAVLKLPPMEWSDDLTRDEIASIIEQVKAGLLTEAEARELMKRPPIEWGDDLTPDEINAMVTQVKEGLLTIEEARASLGRAPVEWPEDLSEKVDQVDKLVKNGFDPADVLDRLGLPPIKHLGLPPTSIQKPTDAVGADPAEEQSR